MPLEDTFIQSPCNDPEMDRGKFSTVPIINAPWQGGKHRQGAFMLYTILLLKLTIW